MPGMLARSKSLRFLTNNRKDTSKQQNEQSMPPPQAPPSDSDKSRPVISTSRAEARCATPELAVRPSTSGATGHTKTTVVPSVYTHDQAPTFPSYPSFPSFPNSTTTLSTSGDTTEEQGYIGIALGSPTTGSHWGSTPNESDATMMHFQQSNSSSATLGNRPVPPKSKLSRWKSLFRKAAPSPAPEKPSFYQVTQTVISATPRADSHHGEESPEPLVSSQKDSVGVRRVLPPTYKTDIRASRRGAPDGFVVPKSPPEFPPTRERALTLDSPSSSTPQSTTQIQRALTSPLPPPKDTPGENHTVPKLMISGSKSYMSTVGSDAGSDERSLLDVSIPDVTMERYSVMFGNVLQPRPQRSSSLLERRQANAERIKPLSKLSAQEEAREISIDFHLPQQGTSPAPAGTPRLTLYPSKTPSRAPSPLSISTRPGYALHRSRTAPAKSPVSQTFTKVVVQSGKGSETNPCSLKPVASPHLKAAITPTSIHSYESDTDSITIVSGQTTSIVQLDEREPTWQMCQKPTTTVTTISTTPPPSSPPQPSQPQPQTELQPQPQPHPTKLSALSSHPSAVPLDIPSPLHRLRSLRNAPPPTNRTTTKRTVSETRQPPRNDVDIRAAQATVGIARSVSVSKANSPRAVLPRKRTGGAGVRSPGGERLVDTQVLMPTMVEVKNRKSQRVQLEMVG